MAEWEEALVDVCRRELHRLRPNPQQDHLKKELELLSHTDPSVLVSQAGQTSVIILCRIDVPSTSASLNLHLTVTSFGPDWDILALSPATKTVSNSGG